MSVGRRPVIRRWLRPTSGPVRPAAGGRPAPVTACRRALLRRDLDHHRSSDGHGPAQAVTADHGPCSTDSRPGSAVSRPRPDTDTGCPPASASSAGRGAGCTTAGAGGGIWPGHGAPRAVSAASLPGVPGDEAGPLGRPPAPLEAGGHHAVRARGGPARRPGPGRPGRRCRSPRPRIRARRPRRPSRRRPRRCGLDPPTGGRLAQVAELAAPPPGHPVADGPVGSEPAEHMGLGEGGELAQGADAQPVQQLGQLGTGRGCPPGRGPGSRRSPRPGRSGRRGRRAPRRTARRPPRPRPG